MKKECFPEEVLENVCDFSPNASRISTLLILVMSVGKKRGATELKDTN